MHIKKNIFVVGLEDFNLHFLKTVKHAENYVFHSLLDYGEIAKAPRFDMPTLLRKAEEALREFPGTIDAIVGYWDFPTTLMMPILRRQFGLPGPSLESVLRCEHKYWSRLEQLKVARDHVPHFELVDPFDEQAPFKLQLPFPFWIKPVKAHSSKLGFKVRNRREFKQSLAKMRRGIWHFSDPFNEILKYADLPEEIAHVHGGYCIAEQIISAGLQCTLEGYVFEGDIVIYGIVDSIRGRNRSSFERYQYPASLPVGAQSRMKDVANKVIAQVGLDNSPFNMEFYYDAQRDTIYLLEINARISKSHCPLFEKVEGTSHQEVMIDVALGRRPEYPLKEGRFKIGAKFMLRRYGEHDDSVVAHAPSKEEISVIEQRFPGTEIQLQVHTGMRLGDSHFRDSYSYELAVIFMGANNQVELLRNYRDCIECLHIQFED